VRSRLPDRLTCADQQEDESDPLLDDAQTVRYGAVGEDEVAQPDEEELEREREALNRITMQATEYVASAWCETCPEQANIAD
jgi:hypothetical protein